MGRGRRGSGGELERRPGELGEEGRQEEIEPGRWEAGTGRKKERKRGAGEEREIGKKKRKRKERRGRKRKEGKKKKKEEVEGPFRETQKTEEGGCKKAGGGKTKLPGGNPRVWG